jgi:hypothetical protein
MTDPAPRSGLQVGDRVQIRVPFSTREGLEGVITKRRWTCFEYLVRLSNGEELGYDGCELTPVASETTEPKRDA